VPSNDGHHTERAYQHVEHDGRQPHQNFGHDPGDGLDVQQLGIEHSLRPGTATTLTVVLAGRGNGSFWGEAR
jgi:hypothetical protein